MLTNRKDCAIIKLHVKKGINKMANYLNFSYEQLRNFSEDAFRKFGFTDEESRIIVDILLMSDLYGRMYRKECFSKR